MKRFFTGCALIAALFIATACSTCAHANGMKGYAPATPAFSWSGLYVGAGAGYGWGDNELTLSAPGGSASINGLSSRGWDIDPRIGLDWQVGSTPFVVGVFGGWDFGKREFDASVSGLGTVVSSELDPSWYAGVRIGLAFQRHSLVYVGYAYTQADLNVSVPVAAGICGTALNCSHDLNGHRFLGGIETAIAPQLALAIEASFTRYETAHLATAAMAPAKLDLDVDDARVMARLNWRPMGGLFGN